MREIGKEQRDVSLDGKMIALVLNKLVKEMGFSKGIAGTYVTKIRSTQQQIQIESLKLLHRHGSRGHKSE